MENKQLAKLGSNLFVHERRNQAKEPPELILEGLGPRRDKCTVVALGILSILYVTSYEVAVHLQIH